jgi:hypothetical protein
MVRASPRSATYLLAASEMKDLGNNEAARMFRARAEALMRGERTSRPQ